MLIKILFSESQVQVRLAKQKKIIDPKNVSCNHKYRRKRKPVPLVILSEYNP